MSGKNLVKKWAPKKIENKIPTNFDTTTIWAKKVGPKKINGGKIDPKKFDLVKVC